MANFKIIIGRAETIDLADLLLLRIPTKTDTGAYLSAIHATDIAEVVVNGEKSLKFNLLAGHKSYESNKEMVVKEYKRVFIENSFGERQNRYKIELSVTLAGKSFKAPFTLADRSKKVFPVLLGRSLLNKRFMVDPSITHINRTNLKDNYKDWLINDDLSDDEEN